MLNQLPLNWIKIDKAFVNDLESNETSQEIIKSILMVCTAFGFKTVIEGVETQEQLEIIRKIGCNAVQGFIYSPPLTAEEFERLYLM